MAKYDKDKVDALIKGKYVDCKVNMVPASLKETYSDLVSKNPVLVSRELIVDGRVIFGVEYAQDGEVAGLYTTDEKGKRVNFEHSFEEGSNSAANMLAQRLWCVKASVMHGLTKPAVNDIKPVDKPAEENGTEVKLNKRVPVKPGSER